PARRSSPARPLTHAKPSNTRARPTPCSSVTSPLSRTRSTLAPRLVSLKLVASRSSAPVSHARWVPAAPPDSLQRCQQGSSLRAAFLLPPGCRLSLRPCL